MRRARSAEPSAAPAEKPSRGHPRPRPTLWWPWIAALAAALCLAPGSRAEDRALLVGLDHYGHPRISPTPGGADDARSVARTLESAFDFPAESIRILVDEDATSEAILRSFREWLIDGTSPGDRVFFLYAGHGSQVADQNGDEEDGLDETLAPWDTDPLTGAGQIRDDQLDGLIAQLSGRRAVLLFDSCHSGTVTRGLSGAAGGGAGQPGAAPGGPRLLPRPDQWARLERRTRGSGKGRSYRMEAAPQGEQRAFDDPETLGRMSGIVAISAAGPGQLAYPIEVDGKYRGALSYLFEQTFTAGSRGLFGDAKSKALQSAESTLDKTVNAAVQGGLGGGLAGASLDDLQKGVTIATLETVIDAGMDRLQKSGRLQGSQRPWFEVLSEVPIEQEPLYGDWQQAAVAAVSNPIDDRRISLRALGGKTVFRRGESLELEIETDRPGYLYLLVFSEQQRATCLFPNALDRENRVSSGAFRVPTHDRYRLPVREPFGRDVLVALVSDHPQPLCERVEYTWAEVLDRVELDAVHEQLRERVRLRGFGVEAIDSSGPAGASATKSADAGQGLGWQTAILVVETVDRPAPGGGP